MKTIIRNCVLIILILITLFVITGCGNTVYNEDNKKSEESHKTIEYKAEVKYIHYNDEFAAEKENQKVIISNYNELKAYCRKLNSDMIYIDDGPCIGTTIYIPEVTEELSMYNEEFFENKSLALMYVSLSSISNEIQLKYAKKENNKVIIEYVINSEGIVTAMGAGLIVVEVDKDITDIEVI